jgi:GDP-L-fucose synthase
MKQNQKIFIAGHNGMVGSAIHRKLVNDGQNNFLLRSRNELDLSNQSDVRNFLLTEKPDQIYLAAAKVGGIQANNSYPAEFIYENLIVQSNVIHQAFNAGVKKILFLGSSCIYPKLSQQPMSEDSLLTGKLESTNEPYAIAKIAGIKLCESYNRQYGVTHQVDYRSVMPTNLYGVGDNYHAENSHVIPGLIRKIHEAKLNKSPFVTIWGTGKPKREFLYVDDMASASVYVMNLDKDIYMSKTSEMISHINVGSGVDITIAELARCISKVIGYNGNMAFDDSKPDGPPRKFMDSSKLSSMGWKPSIQLEEGIDKAYNNFLENIDTLRNK